jgi:hypothetical protein
MADQIKSGYLGESKHDIFISYSRYDDQNIYNQSGWITDFHESLEITLKSALGCEISIWRDSKSLDRSRNFHKGIKDAIKKSGCFLIFYSEGYKNSPHCEEELKQIDQRDDDPPTFVVRYEDDDPKERPEKLRGHVTFDFFDQKDGTQFVPNININHREQFHKELRGLVKDIKNKLKKLKQQIPEAPNLPSPEASKTDDKDMTPIENCIPEKHIRNIQSFINKLKETPNSNYLLPLMISMGTIQALYVTIGPQTKHKDDYQKIVSSKIREIILKKDIRIIKKVHSFYPSIFYYAERFKVAIDGWQETIDEFKQFIDKLSLEIDALNTTKKMKFNQDVARIYVESYLPIIDALYFGFSLNKIHEFTPHLKAIKKNQTLENFFKDFGGIAPFVQEAKRLEKYISIYPSLAIPGYSDIKSHVQDAFAFFYSRSYGSINALIIAEYLLRSSSIDEILLTDRALNGERDKVLILKKIFSYIKTRLSTEDYLRILVEYANSLILIYAGEIT